MGKSWQAVELRRKRTSNYPVWYAVHKSKVMLPFDYRLFSKQWPSWPRSYVWIIFITCKYRVSRRNYLCTTYYLICTYDVCVCLSSSSISPSMPFTWHRVPHTNWRASFFILFVVSWFCVCLNCVVFGVLFMAVGAFCLYISNKVDLCKHILRYENQSWNIWSELNLSTIIEGTVHTHSIVATV